MKKFPDDTHDRIEQLFADRVLNGFPAYGEFWEKFVGWESKDRLLPYELDIPSSTSADREELRERHIQISLAHYTLFHQLAGAHYQLDEALDSEETILDNESYDMPYFLFWESYDNFYQHVGNAKNGVRKLLKEVTALPTVEKPPSLEDYLYATDERELVEDVEQFENEVVMLRDNLVHYSRTWHLFFNDGFYIPLPVREDPEFHEVEGPEEVKKVTEKMSEDLTTTKHLLNDLVPLMGRELELWLERTDIEIILE